jgi:hypothetical protein
MAGVALHFSFCIFNLISHPLIIAYCGSRQA